MSGSGFTVGVFGGYSGGGGTGTGGGSNVEEYRHVVTAIDTSNKYVTLPSIPADPMKLTLDVQHGIKQYSNSDFQVVGNQLRWNGLALELLLEVGFTISSIYVKV